MGHSVFAKQDTTAKPYEPRIQYLRRKHVVKSIVSGASQN